MAMVCDFSFFRRFWGALVLVCLLSSNTIAQFYDSDVEPFSIRWQQIHTQHFRIIFPVDAADDGQKTANVLEYIYKAEGKTLNNYPTQKIPIVLHNQTAFSNGFVVWAPKRSEWFLTPSQDNYAHNWLEQLALHEYRHIVQIDKLNQGLTRYIGFAFGEQSVGAVSGLIPKWFLEGDAVATETALSNAGRGRNPAFEMPLRTIALSEKYQKYDKALFGSYKSHVPNHYELGYQFVAWTRENYDAKTFEKSIDFTARNPHLFMYYPFKIGVKQQTGFVTSKLYENAFTDLTNRWGEQQALTSYDNVSRLTKRKNNLYTNYRSPCYIDEYSFLTLKTGMAQIAQIVKIDKNGREQIVHTPGFINSERISFSNNIVAWSEQVQDIRWTNRSYSVVKMFDLRTGKERTLQKHARHYAPSVSPDGSTLAVVETYPADACAIVIFDIATGREKCRIPNPKKDFLQTPSWSKDGKYLLTIVNNEEGKSIARIDPLTGQYTAVLPPTFDDISHPVDGGQYLFFNAYYNGITNIYALNYRTNEIFQVTSARFGAFDPQLSINGGNLLYADYSINGYDMVEIDIDSDKWTPINKLTDNSLKLYKTLAEQEGFNLQDSVVPNLQYQVKPFRKYANLFNVHSWAPLYYEVDASNINALQLYPGMVLFSQDLLGNLNSSAGYSWRGYNALHAAFTYKALYPVFEFKVEHGGRAAEPFAPYYISDLDLQPVITKYHLRSYIPLNLTRNRWITGVIPQIGLLYDNEYYYSPKTNDLHPRLWRMIYTLQAYRYIKSSARDLAPRLGITLRGALQNTPWNDQFGNIYYIYGRLYLPGIARHHSLRIAGAWQEQKAEFFIFSSLLNFPRGYMREYTEKLKIATVDYSLPLCYPDWNMGFWVYLKRLQANLFCDIAQNSYRRNPPTWQTHDMSSLGIDLIADVNLLRINFPLNIGIRTVYVNETKEVHPSLIFSISFY